MSEPILYSDAHLFPPSAADVERVAATGRLLVGVDGHRPADFAPYADAVAVLAYGGLYDRAVLDVLPALRVISRVGAGFDNIDVAAARERGVEVTYVPGASDDEVAEHTIALLMGMARKISSSDRAVRAGRWPSSAELAPIRRVSGSTLALYGFGRIARATARRARGLDMTVRALDPHVDDEAIRAAGVTPVSSPAELLAGAHFVSLHVPGGGATPLVGAAELALMPASAILVNTARGSLVDTDALVVALRDGRLAGAALDVVHCEPVPAGHPLLALDNVVVTPHSAAFGDEALASLRQRALGEVLTVLAGDPPATPVPRPPDHAPAPTDPPPTDEEPHR